MFKRLVTILSALARAIFSAVLLFAGVRYASIKNRQLSVAPQKHANRKISHFLNEHYFLTQQTEARLRL